LRMMPAETAGSCQAAVKIRSRPRPGPSATDTPMPDTPDSPLTHSDPPGQAHTLHLSAKAHTPRVAVAEGRIAMQPATLALIRSGSARKADVLGIARIAGIQGAKRTSDLIPLCHPIALTRVALEFELGEAASTVICRAT